MLSLFSWTRHLSKWLTDDTSCRCLTSKRFLRQHTESTSWLNLTGVFSELLFSFTAHISRNMGKDSTVYCRSERGTFSFLLEPSSHLLWTVLIPRKLHLTALLQWNQTLNTFYFIQRQKETGHLFKNKWERSQHTTWGAVGKVEPSFS